MKLGNLLRSKKYLEGADSYKQLLDMEVEDLSLQAGEQDKTVLTVPMMLGLPSYQFAGEYIANIISNLEIKMYSEEKGSVSEVFDDPRLVLLNDEPNAYMTGKQLIKAIVREYYAFGEVYVYVQKNQVGEIEALKFLRHGQYSLLVDDSNPLDIYCKIQVLDKEYDFEDFIVITKNTCNGITGNGLYDECDTLFTSSYDNMNYTSQSMANGGVKRGVLKSEKRLDKKAMDALKAAWRKLYKGNNDCIVLNEGISYQELQQTDSELEMQDSKEALDGDIMKVFGIPKQLFDTTKPEEYWSMFVQGAIIPILGLFEASFNRALLKPTEKGKKYFAFDTKNITKGNIEQRYKAYDIALKGGFMTPDEVRYNEDLSRIDRLNFVKLNLADVLMNVHTGEIYTPNTGQTHQEGNELPTDDVDDNKKDDNLKGGEEDEAGNEE